MKIKSVQKQTKAGQRTRFKAVVAVGDGKGHLGVGSKVAKEVQIAMKGAVMVAKLNLIPIRRGNKIGAPHTIPKKITGKCGSVRLRFIPAPKVLVFLVHHLQRSCLVLLVLMIFSHTKKEILILWKTSLELRMMYCIRHIDILLTPDLLRRIYSLHIMLILKDL